MKAEKHCPIAGAGARMTRESFIAICRRHRDNVCQNADVINRGGFRETCRYCEIGKAVEAGAKFRAPARIELVSLLALARGMK